MLDSQTIRNDFPIYTNHPNLVYLDSAATALKPQFVIDELRKYYEDYTSNIHRGLYRSAEIATEAYEQSRIECAKFINAARPEEIVFTRNTTESLNVIASGMSQSDISKGNTIVTTVMEHHSNFVPWQQLADTKGAQLNVIDIDEEGYLNVFNKREQKVSPELLAEHINTSTKILAITYVSNTLGTINPIAEIIKIAKQINPAIIVVVDAAQAAPHLPLDVQALGCDFLALSSHKMLGPTGVGVLWGKYELLQKLPPYQYGGEMISEVTIQQSTFKEPPYKFEAGTPNIADVIAFRAAIQYLSDIGLSKVRQHEIQLTEYALGQLKKGFGDSIRIFGPTNLQYRAGVAAFDLTGAHPHDMAQILDQDEVCIRAGSHCTMPLHQRLGLIGTSRASFYIYNTEADIDTFINSLKKVQKIFG